jgi:solute carrier family 25 protein 44
MLAASLACVLTSPLDLVKTRLQVQGSNPEIFDYKGPMDALKKIVQREGAMALFDGVAARVIWLTPRLSIAVPTYEFLKLHFQKMNNKEESY